MTYAGFDRFGRVTRQLWKDYGADANRAHYNYGYDRSSNRKWRENVPASGKDEYYTYDRLNRLTSMDRGDLAGTYPNYTGISGTPTAERDYTLDALGNWTDYIEKSSGSTTLDQDRTHNSVNETTGISEGGGEEAWIDPAHDARGNMTTVPKPSDLDLAGGFTCAYDSWNRLTEVKQGQTVVAIYEYDGLNRRVKKHIDTDSPADPDGVDVYQHFFYNVGWQALETREATSENDGPEGLNPEYQFVWSLRYIDSPILRDENKDGNSDCISGTDERLYYLTDAQMNVTCLVDTGGDALERYVYDPYGTVTIYDDDWSDTRSVSSYANPILFAGYYRDGETHLLHVRNRMYHPPLGRWMQRDPAGYSEGPHLTQYVLGRPCSFVDPFGLMTDQELFDEVIKRLKWNYTTEDGVHQFTITAKGKRVPGCPPGCPCVDVEVSGTYARKLEKEPPSPLMAKMSSFAVYNLETMQGIYMIGGPNAQEIARKMYWSDPELVAQHMLAEAALTAMKPLIGGILKGMWKNRNLSVSIGAKGRICWVEKKLRSNFCKANIAGAFNVGSTTKAPIENVSVSIGVSIEARGTVDLCKGTIGGSLSGVFEMLIDLPGSWSVTAITIPLGEIPFPTRQIDALKILTPGKLPKCAK